MFDSSVGSKSVLGRNQSKSEALVYEDWNELDKKAQKASDDDIKNLTRSLESSWTDVAALSKVACLNAQEKAKPTLDKLTELGPVKIDAALKVAYKVGEIGFNCVKNKVGQVGADLLSWFYDKKPAETAKRQKSELREDKEAKPDEQPGGRNSQTAADQPWQSEAAKTGKTEPVRQQEEGAESQQASAKQKSADASDLAGSILKDIAPESLRQIWNNIFSGDSKATALAILPVALVKPEAIIFGVIADLSTADPAEKTDKQVNKEVTLLTVPPQNPATEKSADKPEVRVDGAQVSYEDPEKKVRINSKGDGNLAASISEGLADRAAEIFLGADGSRSVEREGRAVYRFVDIKSFLAGNYSSDDLKTLTQKKDGQTLLIASKEEVAEYFENMFFYADREAKNLAEAMENLRKRRPADAAKPDQTILIWYKNGAGLIHPSLQRVLDFRRTPEGIELHYDLGNGQQLRRSPKGKVYLITENQEVRELSDEQKRQVVDGLGTKAEVIRHLLESMESGKPIDLAGGHQITIDAENQTIKHNVPREAGAPGENKKPTEVRMFVDGWAIDDPSRKVEFDNLTGRLDRESDNKPVSIDLNSDKLDMETPDFIRKDGVVTFKHSQIRIDENGAVALPDGTRVTPGNDVHFANGSILYRDGTLVSKDGTIISTALNIPNKANLDAFVWHAISMASSIAGRVQSGSFSPSDIALIEANMSVVQNFINLFSILGNLPTANSLYRSWAILKDSHGKANHESDQERAAENTREREVRSFLKNLEFGVSKQKELDQEVLFAPRPSQVSLAR